MTGTTLGPSSTVVSQGLYQYDSNQNQVLGEKAFSNDGRTFRYVKAGASALIPGNVLQSPAITSAHTNWTPAALSTAGDTTFITTALTFVANEYVNGQLIVEKGTLGAGQSLLIRANPVSTSAIATFTLADAFQTTETGTVTHSLVRNPYSAVIQYPVTTGTGTAVGVAAGAIPASNYGWIVSRGITGVLADGVQTVGVTAAAVPAAAAGAAKVMAATLFQIGVWCKTTIDTQITPCYLTLD